MVAHCACPTKAFYFTYLPKELPDWLSVRALNEHSLIVRVQRARRSVWRLLSHPSKITWFSFKG